MKNIKVYIKNINGQKKEKSLDMYILDYWLALPAGRVNNLIYIYIYIYIYI